MKHFEAATTPERLKQEREANEFAMAILMPERALVEQIAQFNGTKTPTEIIVKRMSKIFQVPFVAMSARLFTLGLVHE